MATLLNRARFVVGRALGTPEPAPAPAQAVPKPKRYCAVEIVTGADCCKAVLKLTGRRYLGHEAPPLPVKGCTIEECLCRYLHHPDRRKGERRTSDVAVTVDEYSGNERRNVRRGRRATD
jgi:hypothetical protein